MDVIPYPCNYLPGKARFLLMNLYLMPIYLLRTWNYLYQRNKIGNAGGETFIVGER